MILGILSILGVSPLYFHKTNILFKKLFPSLVWDKYSNEKMIYLTFDDGPVTDVTKWVLDQLKEYDAKATFFCVGNNAEKQPDIFQQIIQQGHSTGNHTYNHLNGWKTPVKKYLADVEKCAVLLYSKLPITDYRLPITDYRLFRPPYGTLRPSQYSILKTQYSIIMWDVISGDFDQKLSKEKCLAKSIHYTRKGTIIGFHDSYKAEKKLKYVLPRYLKHFASEGYRFEAL